MKRSAITRKTPLKKKRGTPPAIPADRAEALRSNAGRSGRYYWVPAENGCLEWTGHIGQNGYGIFGYKVDGVAYALPAHRAVYEVLVERLPPDLTIDHLCRNTGCVNPAHLEPVTMAENLRRGYSPSALNGRKTVCKRGHELIPRPYGRPGWRMCAICREENQRRRRGPNASTYKKKATKLHSVLVRTRDKHCQRCGRESGLQCAHIISRRFAATRTDERNACALCPACHRFLTENPHEHVKFFTLWLGSWDEYQALIDKAQAGRGLVMNKAFWQQEVERLGKLLGEL